MRALARSFRNVIANWEALLLMIGASLLVVAAAAVPATPVVSEAATRLVSLIVLAFPTAAATRVYIDGERAAYRVFSFPAWLAAGRAAWARVLAIEVISTSIAVAGALGLRMLTRALSRESVALTAAVIVGVLSLVMALLMVLFWSTNAVVIAVGRALGVKASLRIGWETLIEQLGAYFVAGLAIVLLLDVTAFALGKARAILEAVAGCWMLAAFVSIAEHR